MAEPEDGRVFVIDGERCPLADVASFTMAERRVLYDLSGIVQEDFLREEDEEEDEYEARVLRLTRHPGFMEALMHVAYQRKHPELKRAKVETVIAGTQFRDAVAEWEEEEEDVEEADPTAEPSTNGLPEPSPSATGSSSESSGTASQNSSDAQETIPAPTGVIGSAT
jgi:acetolactate synthase regulatory subunit